MPPPPLEPRMIDLSQMERAMSGIADPRLAPAEGPDAYAPKRSLRRLMETASETQSNPRAEDHPSSPTISHSDARMEKTQMGEAPSRAIEDLVNHPKHYTSHPSGVECITITEWMNFNLGNAVKYIWRADDKGDQLTNLRKARWYVDREIARLEKLRG